MNEKTWICYGREEVCITPCFLTTISFKPPEACPFAMDKLVDGQFNEPVICKFEDAPRLHLESDILQEEDGHPV